MESPETLQTSKLLPQSECFVFLEKEPGFTPATGYEKYCLNRDEKGLQHPLFYASTTITSGGYRRDEELPIGEAIAANSIFARQILDESLLSSGFEPSLIVLPSELGKVKGWTQADYLQFWLYIIRGVSPRAAKELEITWYRNPETGLPDIANRMESSASYDEKRLAYIDFVRKFMDMKTTEPTSQLLAPHWPALAMLPFFDNNMSLGCSAEYYFAETVLPNWVVQPKTEGLRSSVRRLLGEGVMVAGVTLEDKQAAARESEKAWRRYYDAEGRS